MTGPLVQYRVAGLSQGMDGNVVIDNRVIGKLSRLEMAQRFLEPAPGDILSKLVADGKVTPQQAELAQRVPMVDDITVEADSGGHTDNRPLVCMLPAFIALRDQVQTIRQYAQPVRIGAGGGIGTPEAALAAFAGGSLCSYRIGQPRPALNWGLGAYPQPAGTDGHGGCGHGTCWGYVRDGCESAGAQAGHHVRHARPNAV